MSKAIDELMKPKANPQIQYGGPFYSGDQWRVVVFYGPEDYVGFRKVVNLTMNEVNEWISRNKSRA
jgi:hypothetical protein